MRSLKELANKRINKEVSFMGEKINVRKLSVNEVMEVQRKAKELEKIDTEENPEEALSVLKVIISVGVEGGEELDSEDFGKFPMDELSSLANAVMLHSGMGDKEVKGN